MGIKLKTAKALKHHFSTITLLKKPFSTAQNPLLKLRNIGISAHIDSGKTTLTERILFYTGKITDMHEVRGKDGIGAKMDSMELEREKGITIKSAATFTRWGETDINIIDTPGHVDFTIEVERSMRVLDGAVLVLCGASGVQSQSITVNRQMDRYGVPRILFINKLDRQGANAVRTLEAVKNKLKINAVLVQIPVGVETEFEGVIDLIKMEFILFEGPHGATVVREKIPEKLLKDAVWHRCRLIEALADVDSIIEDSFLAEKEPSIAEIEAGIRRATIAKTLFPVFVGSAIKNKGVQPLLDGVEKFLPCPTDVQNYAIEKDESVAENSAHVDDTEFDLFGGAFDPNVAKKSAGEKIVPIDVDAKKPLLCLAFKLEESPYGQLTWIRVYQGVLNKGDSIYNISGGNKRVRVNRLVKMHSDQIVDISRVGAGEIAALFGVDCESGATFGSAEQKKLLSSMNVPEPVISLAVILKNTKNAEKFSKALKRFQREDPTFKVSTDEETKELLFSGMGELHLEIYLERLRREYNCDTQVSPPRVSYRERIAAAVPFNYQFKKQTGGRGLYAKIIGRIEPVPLDHADFPAAFVSLIKGLVIPPEFVASVEKGFRASLLRGPLTGSPVQGVRFVLEDGVTHEVDSCDLAFFQAAQGALREAFAEAGMALYEPSMLLEVSFPAQFQSAVVAGLSRLSAQVKDMDRQDETCVVKAEAPLEQMFGYAAQLRGSTEGKGEFAMEYRDHVPMVPFKQRQVVARYSESRARK